MGAIVSAIHRTAQRAQPAVAAILDRIRASPVVHADETGWREDGANGYVWTFSTPTERYFLRRGRGKAVVDEALGESFSGVLVSDFYAAYHHYDGPKQRCWAHLLRDIHDQRTRMGRGVHQLYVAAKACNHHEPWQRRVAQLAWEQLLAICHPFPSRASCAGASSATSRNSSSSWPNRTSADNNPAERHQPQGQRGHPVGTWYREQDDAGIPLRHLARPRSKSSRRLPLLISPRYSKSSRRLPSTARFPATLNCYVAMCETVNGVFGTGVGPK